MISKLALIFWHSSRRGFLVALSEWPGDFKAWLLMEKDGVNYDKDSKGNPILPIFKLAAGETTRGGVEVPVFAKSGPVWKAEQPKEAAK